MEKNRRVFAIDEKWIPVFAPLAGTRMAAGLQRPDTIAIGCVAWNGDIPHAAGLTMCRLEDNIVELTWIYVREEFREDGCATEMMHTLLDALAEDANITDVIVTMPAGEVYQPLHAFLLDIGFEEEPREGDGCWETTIAALDQLPNLGTGADRNVVKLKDVSKIMLRQFGQELVTSNAADAIRLPIDPDAYHTSSAVYRQENDIVAALLIREMSPGEISVAWLYVKQKFSKALPALFRTVVQELKETYSRDTRLTMGTSVPAAVALVKKLLPGAVFYGLCTMSLDMMDGMDREGE